MSTHQKQVKYQYTVSSAKIAQAIEIVCNDHQSREIALLMHKIKKPKRRRLLMHMAHHLVAYEGLRREQFE